MAGADAQFDPRAILAALERNYVDYVVIGGLARVLRGSYEVTRGADVCPSRAPENLERLARAVNQVDGRLPRGHGLDEALARDEVVALATSAGELKVVPGPAGAPSGFTDLRRAATKEHLGHGLQPLVASTADLARMTAALHRPEDVAHLRELRRIMELEVERELTVTPGIRGPSSGRGRRVEPERGLER